MRRPTFFAALLLLAGLAGAAPALAQTEETGEARNLEGTEVAQPAEPESDRQVTSFEPLNSGGQSAYGITRREREIIHGFLTGRRGSIAAWQQGLERLPPGIRDRLQPGQKLPPGVIGRDLPLTLANELPPRGGTKWIAAGYSLVLLDSDSQVILGVWPNAFDIY